MVAWADGGPVRALGLEGRQHVRASTGGRIRPRPVPADVGPAIGPSARQAEKWASRRPPGTEAAW